jgi:uncharacterized iron-regulated protein
MKKVILTLITASLSLMTWAQDKPNYIIYNSKGKKVSFDKMVRAAQKTEITLFGEYHNNPIVHWLQLEFCLAMGQSQPISVGMEMFEADNQRTIDALLKKEIDRKTFDTTGRLWPNFATDYAPILDLATQNNWPFIATNIPRKYARLVHKGGFDALDSLEPGEKQHIAPLPINYDADLPGYKNMLTMMGAHASPKLPMAQAIKDATMAHFILKNLIASQHFVHLNGTYHSDNYEGIGWYLKDYRPETTFTTISTVSQKDVSKLAPEHLGKADFIIVVVENMTTTY